jgi:adenosylcobinamide-phosphate synthase
LITPDHVWMLALALALDAVVGEPAIVWRRVPHPVVWIGALIGLLDRALNRPTTNPTGRRLAGVGAMATVIAVTAGVGYALEAWLATLAYGWIGIVVVAAVMLAGRSLYDHVAAVARALSAGPLPRAREAVGRIVGRDVAGLDAPGAARAAVESLAESFCDGVLAPALWFLLLGLPGLLAYKAINTADSMIGHLTDRHADFGWAAARLDDAANLVPSRLSGALIALAAPLAGGKVVAAFRTMMADAGKHASPNAGWPEAAMAGALGVVLGGPRSYDGVVVTGATFNAGARRDASDRDVRRALRVYLGAAGIFAVVVGAIGLVVALT